MLSTQKGLFSQAKSDQQQIGYVKTLEYIRDLKVEQDLHDQVLAKSSQIAMKDSPSLQPLISPADLEDPRKLFLIIQLDEGQIFQLRNIYSPWDFEGKDERSWRVEKGCPVADVKVQSDGDSDKAQTKNNFSQDDFTNLFELKESFEKLTVNNQSFAEKEVMKPMENQMDLTMATMDDDRDGSSRSMLIEMLPLKAVGIRNNLNKEKKVNESRPFKSQKQPQVPYPPPSFLPSERHHEFHTKSHQYFYKPYAEDLLKSIFLLGGQQPPKQHLRKTPHVIFAANLPRLEIIKLISSMNATRKLDGLVFKNVKQIIDRKYYFDDDSECSKENSSQQNFGKIKKNKKQIDMQKVFGKHFLNEHNQILFFGKRRSIKQDLHDKMLQPMILEHYTRFIKEDIYAPKGTNYLFEMQKLYFSIQSHFL